MKSVNYNLAKPDKIKKEKNMGDDESKSLIKKMKGVHRDGEGQAGLSLCKPPVLLWGGINL